MDQHEVEADIETRAAQPEPLVDREKLAALQATLEAQQNLPLGVAAGLAAGLLGAIIWAVITVATGYQIGWMSVGVGFLVGYAVRGFGKGFSKSFGVAGATCALLGCVLGNLLSACGFVAAQGAVPFFQVVASVAAQPSFAIELLGLMFSPMDLLFYWIALYEGYRLSFRRLTPADVGSLVSGA